MPYDLFTQTMHTIVFDLETTGFAGVPTVSPVNRVVQIAAECVETGVTFQSFVNPGAHEIPPWSKKIHKIDISDCREAPPFGDVWRSFLKTFSLSAHSEVCLVAHNATHFDEIILRVECARAGYTFPPRYFFQDSLVLFRNHYPDLAGYSLGKLHMHFLNEEIKCAHRADADVRALCELYVQFLRKRFSTLNESACILYPDLEDELFNIRFIGPARATYMNLEGIHSITELRAFYNKCVGTEFDDWLRKRIRVWDASQRLFIISRVSGVPMWEPSLLTHMRKYEGEFISEEEYYIYHRFFTQGECTNIHMYYRGLEKIRRANEST